MGNEYLKEKQQKEQIFEAKQNEIDKQIEVRKLKRKLLKMTNLQTNDNKNEKKKFWRKDKIVGNMGKLIVDGNELKDHFGKVVNVEKELERIKKIKEIEKKEQYKRELEQIKAEKKQKRMAKKSKSQILNERLKKANKKMKKNKRKNDKKDDSNSVPRKKRKLH